MLVTYLVNFRQLNDHLSGKELFIRFIPRAFRKLLLIHVISYFPFGFLCRMWDLIVSVPDHCLSFYFDTSIKSTKNNYYFLIIPALSSKCYKMPDTVNIGRRYKETRSEIPA